MIKYLLSESMLSYTNRGHIYYWQNNVKVNSSWVVIMFTYGLVGLKLCTLLNEAKVTIFFLTCKYMLRCGTYHLKPGLPMHISFTIFTELCA